MPLWRSTEHLLWVKSTPAQIMRQKTIFRQWMRTIQRQEYEEGSNEQQEWLELLMTIGTAQ